MARCGQATSEISFSSSLPASRKDLPSATDVTAKQNRPSQEPPTVGSHRGSKKNHPESKKSLRFSDQSKPVPADKDIAIIKNRENIGKIYFSTKDNQIDKLILPIRGYGLWGTLYGYIAIENDFNTVVGIEFYEHKETPGLGGEVDNPNWKNIWVGKEIYQSGDVKLQVIKGAVDQNMNDAKYMVDGLSGATLTSRGVSNMIEYWFSDSGYLKLLENFDYES